MCGGGVVRYYFECLFQSRGRDSVREEPLETQREAVESVSGRNWRSERGLEGRRLGTGGEGRGAQADGYGAARGDRQAFEESHRKSAQVKE